MAAAPTEFPPGQDMTDVSPMDVADAKKRAKDKKGYDEASKPKAYKAGGFVRAADGCVTKGRTKGKIV